MDTDTESYSGDSDFWSVDELPLSQTSFDFDGNDHNTGYAEQHPSSGKYIQGV